MLVWLMYTNDYSRLDSIKEEYSQIKLEQKTINDELYELYSLKGLIEELEQAQSEWVIPWNFTYKKSKHVDELKNRFQISFRQNVLGRMDDSEVRGCNLMIS